MDDASFDRRLAVSTSTISLAALPDRNYNQSCAVRKSSSNMELMQLQRMSHSVDTSHAESSEDSPPSGGVCGAIAIGGPVSGSHTGSQGAITGTGSQFGPTGSRDLSTIMDLSENESRFTDSMNESNTNAVSAGYEAAYPPGGGGIVDTDPESLVGMYLQVKGEAEDIAPSQQHSDGVDLNVSNDSTVSSLSNSKIPKASGGQNYKKGKTTSESKLTKPTLASSAKTNKLMKSNSSVKKRAASGLPKPKPKSTSLSGSSSNSSTNSSQNKSKVPTSKPKPINYYPANLLSAANTAKANIAKMMKSVEEMYTPTVDHHVSTYIQDISDVTDLSELHITKDTEGTADLSESFDDDNNDNGNGDTNDNVQNKDGYHHDIGNRQQLGDSNHLKTNSHGDGNGHDNSNGNNNGYQDSMQSSVQSTNNNNNNCIDKSTVSSLGNYSTPDVGMCVSDSNLAVSSNPGTGSPSDVDDFDDGDNDEDTPEIARDAESEDGTGYVEPEVDVFVPEVDTSHGRRSEEDDDSDSSLEPGMQRAKLFVAINQGKFFFHLRTTKIPKFH